MRYNEYLVRTEGCSPEKRLGILGEVHFYTPEEERMAQEIIESYETVAYETAGDEPLKSAWSALFWYSAAFLYSPSIFAYVLSTRRTLSDRKNIAKALGKRIKGLEDPDDNFPLQQKIKLITGATVRLILSPIAYVYYKKYGDPFEAGTQSYETLVSRKRSGKKPGYDLFSLLTDEESAFSEVREKRDKSMALKAAELLKTSSDLLAVCGESHFDGIIRNLCKEARIGEPVVTKELNPTTGFTKNVEEECRA